MDSFDKKVPMTIRELEIKILQAFQNLDVTFLSNIDEDASYSDCNKKQLVISLDKIFQKIKGRGIFYMRVEESKCKFCYPLGKAYSFYDPETKEFIIRYVIYQENEKLFRVEECRNRIIPDGEDGLPF